MHARVSKVSIHACMNFLSDLLTELIVHYSTRDLLRRLGLLKQGVTIFTIT